MASTSDQAKTKAELLSELIELRQEVARLKVVENDCLEQKQAEEKFRVLFEYSSDAHLIFDETGIIDCNNAAIQMLRCKDKREVLALHPAQLSPEYQPDGRRSLEKAVEMDVTAREQGYHRFEWIHRRMDGEEFPVEVTLNPVTLNNKSALLVVWHDIAERKQADEVLLKQTAEFEDANSFLDSIVKNIPIMVVVKDAQNLRFVRWNKYAEELVGISQDEVIGKTDYDFFPKKEADFFTGKDREVLAGGQLVDIPEEPIQTAAGETRLLHTQKVPIYGSDGKPKYLLAIAEDITERKQSGEALFKRARELETVARVGTAASTILETDRLLQEVVDLTKNSFGLYHAHIYLLNSTQDTLILAAGAGEVGRQMVSQGWSIPLGREQSLVAQAARNHHGVTVNDVRQDPDFLPNPLLPETRAEMAIPLIVGEQILGVLDVQANHVGRFTEEDVRLKTILAGQVAVALQNARSFAEQQQARLLLNDRVKELNCLNEIGREIAEAPPVPELLQWATERIPPAMRYTELCMAAIEYDGQIFGVAEAIDLPCQIVHALRIGGEVMGRIYIAYTEKREFLDEESALIGGIAGRLGGYIESRRLFEQTQEAQAESEILYTMANQLIQAADPAELLEAASSYARSLGASGGTLLYIDNDLQGNPEWSEIIAQWLVGNQQSIPTGSRFYLPEFPLSKLWISSPNQPLLISDVLTDKRVDPVTRKLLAQSQSSTFALISLNIKNRWVGLLSFNWSESYSFTKYDEHIFSAIAQQTVSVVDAVRSSQQTQTVLAENQQQKELLDKIIEFMPVGVFAKDVQNDYKFTIWNSKMEDLFGVKRETMLGKTDYDYNTNVLADQYRQADVAAVEARQIIDIPVEEITTSRGVRLAHTTKLPIYDSKGKPEILLVVLEDITERKQAELEREKLLAEVEAAYRQFVRREWQNFLSETHQGDWQVEHRSSSGVNIERTQLDEKLFATQQEVMAKGKTKVVAGANNNGHSTEPAIVAPITLRGQVIGTLSLQDIAAQREWSDEEKALVETVSEQLALTVENLRLFDDTQKRATREQITRQISDKMRAAPDVETIIQTGLTELAKALGVSRSYVKLTVKPEEVGTDEA